MEASQQLMDMRLDRGVCPRCGGFAYRIPRRFIDLLISFFMPIRRYRCRSKGCRWEGNLRRQRDLPRDSSEDAYDGKCRVLEASQMTPVKAPEKPPR